MSQLSTHTIALYPKPAIGGNRIGVYEAQEYKHRISSIGGFDTASCVLNIPFSDAELFLSTYIGNRVEVYADNPVVPIWEGYINRIMIDTGVVQITRSLESMSNNVIVQYADNQTATRVKQTSAVSNADSIATYGTKTQTYDLGELGENGTATSTTTRTRLLNDLAYPQTSLRSSTGGQATLRVEMLGFYHTWAWESREVTDTTLENANQVFKRAVLTTETPSYGPTNGSLFYDATDDSEIDAVATGYNRTNERRLGQTLLSFVRSVIEAGSGGNRIIAGVTPTDINTGKRRAYLRLASTDVQYMVDAYGDGTIYDAKTGYQIAPWTVQPDNVIMINTLIEDKTEGDKYTVAYITAVEYDGENGTVAWQSDDDTTISGIFALNQSGKSTARNLGFTVERRIYL